ncbi:MAG: hypothetical protein GKR89_03320 [Candidatus Latescibacteria bacterium]|nr:hypothetical protein [Candidatus Latescibacterota bacterium]
MHCELVRRKSATSLRELKLVLFICHGNVARSQFAEALLRSKGYKHVASAGTHITVDRQGNTLQSDGQTARESAEYFLQATGIDISGNKRKLISRDMVQTAQVIVVITLRENLPSYVMEGETEILFWDIDDPNGTALAGYQNIISEIGVLVDQLCEKSIFA